MGYITQGIQGGITLADARALDAAVQIRVNTGHQGMGAANARPLLYGDAEYEGVGGVITAYALIDPGLDAMGLRLYETDSVGVVGTVIAEVSQPAGSDPRHLEVSGVIGHGKLYYWEGYGGFSLSSLNAVREAYLYVPPV